MGSVLGIITEETPKYDVIRALAHGAELRAYRARLVAQVEYMPDADTGSPFMTLAKYIGVVGQPENTGSTAVKMTAPVVMGSRADGPSSSPAPSKIQMTAPVIMGSREKGAMAAPSVAHGQQQQPRMQVMQFVLPSELTLATAPTPTNDRVKIVEEPPRLCAALSFSGSMRQELIDAKGAQLLDAVRADGKLALVSVDPKPHYFGGFNPPWTLPWLRTNEVYVDVTEAGGTSASDGPTSAASGAEGGVR